MDESLFPFFSDVSNDRPVISLQLILLSSIRRKNKIRDPMTIRGAKSYQEAQIR